MDSYQRALLSMSLGRGIEVGATEPASPPDFTVAEMAPAIIQARRQATINGGAIGFLIGGVFSAFFMAWALQT